MPRFKDDDVYTTLALGEEGDPSPFPGDPPVIDYPGCPGPPEATTLALGEEGAPYPYPIDPPEFTTLALGEEGDDFGIAGADPLGF